ncbi:MAG TPA: DUF4226 domain-containing protein, partial [Mycobacterium sp.]|nr:DUF4226 domain-containing protein [Mycobacterium sp.]
MTTRQDVLDAISRIEKAGYAGEATKVAQLELLLGPQDYDRIVKRLQAALPQLFTSAGRAPATPPPDPAPEQQGIAARAMRQAETALAHQQSAIADFDRQVIEALLSAHKTTGEGWALLDDLENQVECAARSWDLSTAAGAREFQRFLITKLDQVIRVVEEANDDDRSKRALAAAWAALYAAQAGPDKSTATGRGAPPDMSDQPPQDPSDVAAHPYLGMLPPDEVETAGADLPQRGVPIAPAIPA